VADVRMPVLKSPIWLMVLGLIGNGPGLRLAHAKAEAASASARKGAIKLDNFSLRDHAGKTHELYNQTDARAIVLIFTSTGCPIVQKSVPKIKALRDEFAAKGVVFWLVNSNAQDDSASIVEEAKDFGIDLPILLDQSQSVARALNASRTAETICIQAKSWTVVYRGAIDDQFGYGSEKTQASQPYLENALKNLLAGKRITPTRTDVKGCVIQIEPARASEKNGKS